MSRRLRVTAPLLAFILATGGLFAITAAPSSATLTTGSWSKKIPKGITSTYNKPTKAMRKNADLRKVAINTVGPDLVLRFKVTDLTMPKGHQNMPQGYVLLTAVLKTDPGKDVWVDARIFKGGPKDATYSVGSGPSRSATLKYSVKNDVVSVSIPDAKIPGHRVALASVKISSGAQQNSYGGAWVDATDKWLPLSLKWIRFEL